MTTETCQFCEKVNGFTGTNSRTSSTGKYPGKVKYGKRHYAHFECFLERKSIEGFNALNDSEKAKFPHKLLEAWGLAAKATPY